MKLNARGYPECVTVELIIYDSFIQFFFLFCSNLM